MRCFIDKLHNVTGGNTSIQVFYCKVPGCAANVTKVCCKDEFLFIQPPMADCSGPPQPKTVCQRDGHAFVSIDTLGSCEFERDAYIETEKCTGIGLLFFLKSFYVMNFLQ